MSDMMRDGANLSKKDLEIENKQLTDQIVDLQSKLSRAEAAYRYVAWHDSHETPWESMQHLMNELEKIFVPKKR